MSMQSFVPRCAAEKCKTPIPGNRFMCDTHWSLVPKDLQRRLADAQTPRQWITRVASPAWKDAAVEAVAAVAEIEGRDWSKEVKDALEGSGSGGEAGGA